MHRDACVGGDGLADPSQLRGDFRDLIFNCADGQSERLRADDSVLVVQNDVFRNSTGEMLDGILKGSWVAGVRNNSLDGRFVRGDAGELDPFEWLIGGCGDCDLAANR